MGKKNFLSLAMLAIAGSIAYTVNYLAKNDEFSNDTKDDYRDFLKSAKNVGEDLKRTYININDKDGWTKSTKSLSNSAMNLAKDTGDLVLDASSDMYNFLSNKYTEVSKKVDADKIVKDIKKKVNANVNNIKKKVVSKKSTKNTKSKTNKKKAKKK